MNETFDKFASDVAPSMTENAERLSESIKNFTETSARNVEIQRELMNTSQQLSDSVKATEAVVDNLKTIYADLASSQQEILENIESSFREHQSQMLSTTQQSAAEFRKVIAQNQSAVESSMQSVRSGMSELNKAAFKTSVDISDKIKHFNETIDDVLNKISKALDHFNTDFRDELTEAMKQLKVSFETLAKVTGEQQNKALDNLAAALGKITERMTGNYTTLVNRINEVDQLLVTRR